MLKTGAGWAVPLGDDVETQAEGRPFGVSRWAAWPSGGTENGEAPNVQFVPALLRRRLSRLSRMALAVAHECLDGARGIPVVFASQHGELNRTADILGDLAQQQPLSPTAFSLSVHNSATGLLALAHEDRAPATAIAAGTATFAMGLVEALVQATDSEGGALLIYADEQPPALYQDVICDSRGSFAFAFLIEANGSGLVLEAVGEPVTPEENPAAALIEVMAGSATVAAAGTSEQCWQVRRNG